MPRSDRCHNQIHIIVNDEFLLLLAVIEGLVR